MKQAIDILQNTISVSTCQNMTTLTCPEKSSLIIICLLSVITFVANLLLQNNVQKYGKSCPKMNCVIQTSINIDIKQHTLILHRYLQVKVKSYSYCCRYFILAQMFVVKSLNSIVALEKSTRLTSCVISINPVLKMYFCEVVMI